MVAHASAETETETLSPQETEALLQDTAKAVKVMKASWLRVALNLRRIREHRLWRFSNPPCKNYEEYVLGVLKLNKYVANRMLQAMSYTEERRPDLIENYMEQGENVDLPSFDVVNQLRRAQTAFGDRENDFQDLESRVYDDGVGRVTLKKEIDEKLGTTGDPDQPPPPSPAKDVAPEEVSLEKVLESLREIEKQLLKLEVSKEARQLAFQLVEKLQKEQKAQT